MGKTGKGITLGPLDYVLVENRVSGEKSVKRGPCIWFPTAEEEGKKKTATSLSDDEYVRITDNCTGERRIERGPCVWFPSSMESGQRDKGISLSNREYVLVEDEQTGENRVERGPMLWFPGPMERGLKRRGITLKATEYITVEDRQTGAKGIVRGPCVWFPKQPCEGASEVQEALSLQEDEYLLLKDLASGKRWVAKGKALIFLEPTWKVEVVTGKKGREGHGIRKAWVLKKHEYIRLQDTITGSITTHRGEAIVFPEANQVALDDDKLLAIDLKVNEYVKIMDQASGEIRVVRGRQQVFLGPYDCVVHKQKAVVVDDEHAVLVRNSSTGQLRLVTEKQLFVPGPDESIEEVRRLISLAEHEAIIIKDKDGQFQYHFGCAQKRSSGTSASFFLPPYAEVVRLCWSRGRRRDKRDLYIEKFDCRAQFMSFEFTCRTKDNVELILEGTFFWEVVDLPRMVRSTGDTSGDLCSHARSQFIKHVARVTLKEFMDDLNVIASKVYQDDLSFYESRGVKVHSLEVTSYKCAEDGTSQVLQQIIAETTNRMNRLSKQESENEVKIFRMQGQIEQERLNGDLLSIQHQHAQQEAEVAGSSEAYKIRTFMESLEKEIPGLEERFALWEALRKTETLSVLAEGGTSFFYTPKDVDLSIGDNGERRAAS